MIATATVEAAARRFATAQDVKAMMQMYQSLPDHEREMLFNHALSATERAAAGEAGAAQFRRADTLVFVEDHHRQGDPAGEIARQMRVKPETVSAYLAAAEALFAEDEQKR